jgi:hypothetical protein
MEARPVLSKTLLVALMLIAIPKFAGAQTFEGEFGAGYVFGGGTENPGPSLPAFDVGFVVWPTGRWGIAARLVEGPGEDLHEPIASSDRTFLGAGHLHYWSVTAQHRWTVNQSFGVQTGFGLMFDGRFATVQEFHDPVLGRRAEPDTFFTGFSLEGLVTRTLSRHLGIKGGVTYDFNFETNNLQPVVLGTIQF